MKLPVLLAVLAVTSAARADLLFNQTTLNGNSFDITDYRLAADFKPTLSGTVNELQFWYQAQDQSDLAAITYALYADNHGTPGSLLVSGTVDDPNTGYDDNSGLFTADFAIHPVAVSSSASYWLELHAGSSLEDASGFTISWAGVDDTAAPDALMNLALGVPNTPVGVSGFNQYAFDLAGSPVPEPAVWAELSMCALVAAGKVFLRRKK